MCTSTVRVLAVVLVPPYSHEKVFPGKDATDVLHEIAQQLELHPSELDRFAVHCNAVFFRVNGDGAAVRWDGSRSLDAFVSRLIRFSNSAAEQDATTKSSNPR